MKQNYEQLSNFISLNRSFFEDALLPEINAGSKQYSWESQTWTLGGASLGVFATNPAQINFVQVQGNKTKGIFKDDEEKSDIIDLNPVFSEFIKAYCVSLFRNRTVSGSVVRNTHLLFKRVYVRMLMGGLEPHPVNITSEFVQEAVDLCAQSRTGKSADTNAANDYILAKRIVKELNYLGIPQTELEIEIKQTSIGLNYTEQVKNEHKTEGEDQNSKDKNLSIQTFLNIVALRSLVQNDGEKIVLNFVLLLMVTGFRHMEAATVRYDNFKVVEISDPHTKDAMEKRGLPTYFVGLKYGGEKQAGIRTHWFEPLAVDILEEIVVDTICLTEKLRRQVEHVRANDFNSLLPYTWGSNDNTDIIGLQRNVAKLDFIVDDVYESYTMTVVSRGRGAARDYAYKKLIRYGVMPLSETNNRRNSKERCYYHSDIDMFIKECLEEDGGTASDLIWRYTDSDSKEVISTLYEQLLFIIPLGSANLSRQATLKVIPQVIDNGVINTFLGYGTVGNRQRSVFAKYNLTNENGDIDMMYSHCPRHGINTFYALADVSDHLQAMFMGRNDINQNKSYQHLSFEDRAISTELVSFGNTKQFSNEGKALESVKQQAYIKINPSLNPSNALAQTLGTHTTKEDKTSFIVDLSINSSSDVFAEFGELFKLIGEEEMDDTSDLIRKKAEVLPHSDLHEMSLGSCMRKVSTFSCPYNMKCQDGAPCAYFTLTGRSDEEYKIKQLGEKIASQIAVVNHMELTGELSSEECEEILSELNSRQDNVSFHQNQSDTLVNEKKLINLLVLDKNRKPKMLSEIFAIAQREIKAMKELEYKRQKELHVAPISTDNA
ncbi:TPA: hypothetical protein ACGF1Q_002476 [Vibrio cholerae]|uniref:hypothetical protein n=1 Tax=Vibrio cholerae TaxID=666 RepID=UPI0010FEBEA8|nr:hypothetical protein [Vibrio cholerae]TLE13213.1 hypothetical protein D2B32_08665 [Vibrio cholerae]TLE20143.1 hypothetical protein D2923_08555 [Vibrio cholerae]